MPAEDLRPAFHFSPARNWMNDPNGLVWHDGEYHLFFQHNPEGTDWGNMSWGHAVSPDLLHWEELPVALTCTATEHVFSGSVVVDHRNTSGLGSAETPPMVALYTGHDVAAGVQRQAVAYSLDKGRTWTRYAGNPVLDIGSTDFRDPKVFWYDDGGYWVMVVALAAERVVQLYRSGDLLQWEHLSDFGPAGSTGGVWECPDLFPLCVDGDPSQTRWVLVISVQEDAVAGGSGMQYFVGGFDGVKFAADACDDATGVDWVDFGADFYAAVSFADTPDGRRILLGWMNNWTYAGDVPTTEFRGSMSLPRSWELRTVDGHLRLVQQAVLPALPQPSHEAQHVSLTGVHPLPPECHGARLRVVAVLEVGTAERLGLFVRVGTQERTVVGYDVRSSSVYVDRSSSGATGFHPKFPAVHRAALTSPNGLVRLEVYVDSTSVEVFAGEGEVVVTDQIFPSPDSTGLAVFAEGGTALLRSVTVSPMA